MPFGLFVLAVGLHLGEVRDSVGNGGDAGFSFATAVPLSILPPERFEPAAGSPVLG